MAPSAPAISTRPTLPLKSTPPPRRPSQHDEFPGPDALAGNVHADARRRRRAARRILRSATPVEDMDSLYSSGTGLMYDPHRAERLHLFLRRFNALRQQFLRQRAVGCETGSSRESRAPASSRSPSAAGTCTSISTAQPRTRIGTNIFSLGKQFDDGVAALIGDLQAAGMLESTMIVAVGEFGRTPTFTAALGRDHYLNQFAFFAGGGVQGGRIIGATDATGANILDNGWSQNRRRESRRYRSHHLLRDGHRLDDDLLQRPVPPRLRIRPAIAVPYDP